MTSHQKLGGFYHEGVDEVKDNIMNDSKFQDISDIVDTLGSVLDFEDSEDEGKNHLPKEPSLEEEEEGEREVETRNDNMVMKEIDLDSVDKQNIVKQNILDDSKFVEISKVMDRLGTTLDQDEPEPPKISEDPFMHFNVPNFKNETRSNRNTSFRKLKNSKKEEDEEDIASSSSEMEEDEQNDHHINAFHPSSSKSEEEEEEREEEGITSSSTKSEEDEENDQSYDDFLQAVDEFKVERKKEKKIEKKKREVERKIQKEEKKKERIKKIDDLIENMEEFTKTDSSQVDPIKISRRRKTPVSNLRKSVPSSSSKVRKPKKNKRNIIPKKKNVNDTDKPPILTEEEIVVDKTSSSSFVKIDYTDEFKKLKEIKEENKSLKQVTEILQKKLAKATHELDRFTSLRTQELSQNQHIIEKKENQILEISRKMDTSKLSIENLETQLFEMKCQNEEISERNKRMLTKLESDGKLRERVVLQKRKIQTLLQKQKKLENENKGLRIQSARELVTSERFLRTLNTERSLLRSSFDDFEIVKHADRRHEDSIPIEYGGDGYDSKTGTFLGIFYNIKTKPSFRIFNDSDERKRDQIKGQKGEGEQLQQHEDDLYGCYVYFNISENSSNSLFVCVASNQHDKRVEFNDALIRKIPYQENLMRIHHYFTENLEMDDLKTVNFSKFYGDVDVSSTGCYEYMKKTGFLVTSRITFPFKEKGPSSVSFGSDVEFMKFVKDVATGIFYLHHRDLIHRDIRVENIGYSRETKSYVITNYSSLLDISPENIYKSENLVLLFDRSVMGKPSTPPEISYYDKNIENIKKSVKKTNMKEFLKKWDVFSLGKLCFSVYSSSRSSNVDVVDSDGDKTSIQNVLIKEMIFGMLENNLQKRFSIIQVFRRILSFQAKN